jgi:hypothetical protein
LQAKRIEVGALHGTGRTKKLAGKQCDQWQQRSAALREQPHSIGCGIKHAIGIPQRSR